jgi:hypothetical protein
LPRNYNSAWGVYQAHQTSNCLITNGKLGTQFPVS